jgi:hypothetical protein
MKRLSLVVGLLAGLSLCGSANLVPINDFVSTKIEARNEIDKISFPRHPFDRHIYYKHSQCDTN